MKKTNSVYLFKSQVSILKVSDYFQIQILLYYKDLGQRGIY